MTDFINESDRPRHLSEHELAGYIDRTLESDERGRVEAHLEACETCRAELVAVTRAADSYSARALDIQPKVQRPRGRRPWFPTAVGAALAASIAAVFLLRPPPATSPDAGRVRGSVAAQTGEGEARIRIVSPADNALVAVPLGFRWRSAPGESYRLTLLSESGAPIWQHETSDTSATVPPTVALQAGRAYFWRVEAMADGVTATTGSHRLELRP